LETGEEQDNKKQECGRTLGGEKMPIHGENSRT